MSIEAKTCSEAPSRPSNDFVSDNARKRVDDALSGLDFEAEEHGLRAPVAPINGHAVEAVFERAVRECIRSGPASWLNRQPQ